MKLSNPTISARLDLLEKAVLLLIEHSRNEYTCMYPSDLEEVKEALEKLKETENE